MQNISSTEMPEQGVQSRQKNRASENKCIAQVAFIFRQTAQKLRGVKRQSLAACRAGLGGFAREIYGEALL